MDEKTYNIIKQYILGAHEHEVLDVDKKSFETWMPQLDSLLFEKFIDDLYLSQNNSTS